jgi:hypothetical protein
VPLRATKHGYDAGKAVVATFARLRGAIPSKFAFDLSVGTALPPTAVLAVHTEGDAAFESMGAIILTDLSMLMWAGKRSLPATRSNS